MITDTNPTYIWQALFTSIPLPRMLWLFHQSHFHWKCAFSTSFLCFCKMVSSTQARLTW